MRAPRRVARSSPFHFSGTLRLTSGPRSAVGHACRASSRSSRAMRALRSATGGQGQRQVRARRERRDAAQGSLASGGDRARIERVLPEVHPVVDAGDDEIRAASGARACPRGAPRRRNRRACRRGRRRRPRPPCSLIGRCRLSAWLDALCSVSGASTTTSAPAPRSAARMARIPGLAYPSSFARRTSGLGMAVGIPTRREASSRAAVRRPTRGRGPRLDGPRVRRSRERHSARTRLDQFRTLTMSG